MSILRRMGLPLPEETKEEELLYAIWRTWSYLEGAISDTLRPFRLSSTTFSILMIAKHVGGKEGLSQTKLAQVILSNMANVTIMIDRQERAGRLKRVPHPTDRRQKLIRITPQGSKLLDQVWPIYLKKVKEFSRGLSENERRALVKLLTLWGDRLGHKGGEKQ